ncbi:hypothetical protein ADL15_46610 [Actinoplanes awajinensis subsp. mycoplanecinus]|uniref:Uncharacterized protein n=1 Tax=Actinoplanes awajinensis subsp. mycoplanecinus TaxID=135947 RepID=A0A101JAS4_9ACTN|nr:hypothetical protein ADL15_46610 [Actinoplanes awajinensis subsp. mycoplanecinus]
MTGARWWIMEVLGGGQAYDRRTGGDIFAAPRVSLTDLTLSMVVSAPSHVDGVIESGLLITIPGIDRLRRG